MTTTILNEHGESPLLSSKYVSSSSMNMLNSVGEEGYPCLTSMFDITSLCVLPLIHTLCKLWYTWLLQVLVSLIIGGISKACQVQVC